VTGATIPLEHDSSSTLSSLADWLRSAETGPWIVVLDGLEDEAIAQELNAELPTINGETLITTKNKIILTKFLDVNNKNAFIRMDDLPLLTASYIFDSHINRDLITNTESRDFVVERLPLPALIISMADHMNRTEYTTQNLQEDERSGANHTIEQQYSDFSGRLLMPFLPSLGDSGARLILLGELSCLDASRIDFALLLQVHTKPDRLQSQLSGLEQCCLISTVENRVYTMQQYVQVAVLQWYQVVLGDARLLQLYATALCMLYKRYEVETQERYKQVKGKSRVPSRHWKLPYKPHFDRFLEFARKNKDKARARDFASCSIKGIDVMVTSIVTFSKLYLEEHRYDDAICVLEFVDAMYTGSERRYELKRLLIRAYLEKPLRDECNDKWSKIVKLSAQLIEEADKNKDIERKWALVLDLARFYSESHQPEKALQELKSVWEFEMNMDNGEAKVYINLELPLDKSKKRKFAVQRKIEEGRVHFIDAKLRLHKRLDDAAAKEIVVKAIHCWEDAMQGIASWQLDHDDEWTVEIEEMIAEAYIESGRPEKAEDILAHHLQRLQRCPDNGGAEHAAKRVWDIECKQAHAWIKRGDKQHRIKAIGLLKERLGRYEHIYGNQDACTRNCAYLLRSALRKDDQDDEARMLEQKHQLREISAVQVAMVQRTGMYMSLARLPWPVVLFIGYITERLLCVLWNWWWANVATSGHGKPSTSPRIQ
jgi:ketosteroid isomerase-like protein